jgi:hypothetical protein
MKTRAISSDATFIEEKIDIVATKDFLSVGKFMWCRCCDAVPVLVNHFGDISVIEIEGNDKAKLGWSS